MGEHLEEKTPPAPEPTPTPPAPEGWQGPSEEEWKSVVETNKKLSSELEGLVGAFAEPPGNKEEFDLGQIDMTDPYQAAWLMDQIVKERMASVTPYVKNAAQDQGQKQLVALLDSHEKELAKDYPAGFDKKLAERASFSFFDETGDPAGSVAAGARYAAEVRKAEREASIAEYKKQNSRGGAFSDLGATESGVKSAPTLKTYDEVLEKYFSQSEV